MLYVKVPDLISAGGQGGCNDIVVTVQGFIAGTSGSYSGSPSYTGMKDDSGVAMWLPIPAIQPLVLGFRRGL